FRCASDTNQLILPGPRIHIQGFQPCLFPEDQAPCVATAVCLPVAASLEMDCAIDPASPNREDGIASLMRPLVNLKALAAEGKHLRHERHAIQLPIAVERRQYLILASDLNPIARFQFRCLNFHASLTVFSIRPKPEFLQLPGAAA